MLKIRLMRIGAKKRPFYRVVAIDERSKRNGEYVELLGTYNPLTEPKEVKLKQDRIDHWLKQGAQPSEGFLRIIGKAPQRPARKPKKERQQAVGGSEQVKQEVSEGPVKSSEPEETPNEGEVKSDEAVDEAPQAEESQITDNGSEAGDSEEAGPTSEASEPTEEKQDK
jgi:small subunit ribosomal protein S16